MKDIGLVGAVSVLKEWGYEPQNIVGASAGALSAATFLAKDREEIPQL